MDTLMARIITWYIDNQDSEILNFVERFPLYLMRHLKMGLVVWDGGYTETALYTLVYSWLQNSHISYLKSF